MTGVTETARLTGRVCQTKRDAFLIRTRTGLPTRFHVDRADGIGSWIYGIENGSTHHQLACGVCTAVEPDPT